MGPIVVINKTRVRVVEIYQKLMSFFPSNYYQSRCMWSSVTMIDRMHRLGPIVVINKTRVRVIEIYQKLMSFFSLQLLSK